MKGKKRALALALIFVLAVSLAFATVACKDEKDPPAAKEGTLYQTPVQSFWAGIGNAYITFESADGKQTFNVNVNAGDGYSAWLSGTWTIAENADGTFGDLTLTATFETGDNATYLADAKSGEAKVYKLVDGKYTIGVNLPSAGTINFTLDPVKDAVDDSKVTYTVKYMLNAGDTTTLYTYEGFNGTQEITGAPEEAYIAAAPTAPTREGYYFAGWQTKAEITEADIVNGVSRYLWMFGQKLSETGIAKFGQMTEEEKEGRAISDEVMLLDSADKDGTVTLYARWVKEVEIDSADDLKDIANDLYGAYKLTDNVTLTGNWEPIGAYFANYEYYNTEWWTYAFRGTLNGNGKTISGLNIESAQHNKNYAVEGSVWHDDGVTCDGTAAMFSALAGAKVSDLTIDKPVVNVTYSGDYLYVGALAAFDMTSTLTNIKVVDCDIDVTYDERGLVYRDNLFTVVAGLEAGGWSNVVTACEVTGDIKLNAVNKVSHGGEIYLGGLLGENYSTMTSCKSDVALNLDYKDEGTDTADQEMVVNVGGLSGSGTSISASTVKVDVTVRAVKASGASSVNVGGIVGSQRYMTISGNTVEGAISTTACSLDAEKGKLNVGGVGGRIDVYYMLQILAYTPIATSGAENNVQNVTVNGEVTDKIIADAISAIPGCWYVAKGDQLEGAAPSNIDAVIEAYGSYLPKDRLLDGIVYIMNTPPQADEG